MSQAPHSQVFDLLVFGSGAGGLMAALVGAENGLKVCVCERTDQLGGTTATSGGTIWVPGINVRDDGDKRDDLDRVRSYLRNEIGDCDADLREAFLESAPETLRFLKDRTRLRFIANDPYPDYHTETPGAAKAGRALTPKPFDGRSLGTFFSRIRPPIREYMVLGGMMVGRNEIPALVRPWRSLASMWTTARLVSRYTFDRLRGLRGTRLYLGNALVAGLVEALRKHDCTFFFETSLDSLLTNDGKVVGARVRSGESIRPISARKGVVVATGGFSANLPMMKVLTGNNVSYSASFAMNVGDGIRAARDIGAAVSDDHRSGAFWMPVSVLQRSKADRTIYPHIRDRAKPGMICVTDEGLRFVNESASYHDVSGAMRDVLERRPDARFYLICDRTFVWTYGVGMINPVWQRLNYYINREYLNAADRIESLASKLNMSAAALSFTIDRHNEFAATGIDLDFGKGSTFYNRFNGDQSHQPNPCLANIQTPPFFAIQVYPAPIGTSVGLTTDINARVLRPNGEVIDGLYAAGNDMSSIMRGTYPGPGITLGPHLVFAYRAAQDACRGQRLF
jgi:succinate dehydrogenase/fumarate reductase flavoprotein subunit